MEYAKKHFFHPTFSSWFTPKTPFNPALAGYLSDENGDRMEAVLHLEELLDQIQPEHIEFPILMKQYIRQNARFLGFNLDPNFNNALDGLMILDIAEVPEQTIEMLQRES